MGDKFGHAAEPLSRLIRMLGLILIFAIATGGPASPTQPDAGRAAVSDDPDIMRLAGQAKAAFRRRMEPPVIKISVADIKVRDWTTIVRELALESYDAAVDALLVAGQAPQKTGRVKAALRQLVDTGDADLAEAVFTEVAERKAGEGESAKRDAAAYLRHSVALVELPAALAPTIKLPGEALPLSPLGDKAAPAYARAADWDPDNPWGWIVLSNLSSTQEAFDYAIQNAARAAQAADDGRARIVALQVAGLARDKAGRHAQAERAYRGALFLARQWTTGEPASALAQRYLALALNRLGDALMEQKRFAEAAAAYEESLSIRDRLARAEPQDPRRQIDLIAAHMNLFDLASAEDDKERAKTQLDEASRLYKALAAQEPFRASYNAFQSGTVAVVLIASGTLTLIVAVIALARYRRLIRRYMLATASVATGPSASVYVSVPPRAGVGAADLQLCSIDALTKPRGGALYGSAALAGADRAARRAAWTYGIAGLTFAVASAIILLGVVGIEITWPRMTSFILSWAWPVVFTIALLWGPDRRRLALLIAGYFAVLLLFCTRMAFSSTPPLQIHGVTFAPFFQPLYLVVDQAAPSLFLLLFLNRQVRAVGPVLLVLMIVVCIGMEAAVLGASTYAGMTAVLSLGLPAVASLVGVHLVGMALFLPLGWLAIAWLRRWYDRKRLSEQTLVHDSVWLFQTAHLCLNAIQGIGAGGFFAAAVFPLYKVIVWLGLRPLAAAAASCPPARLLLLRTFGFQRRSERFFDLLGARWRYAGPIQLIAAPDLASRSIGPDEFLDFLSGRLRHRFIIEHGDLERRIAEMDNRPDPDGRFRVNEFFCGNDAWRPAVRRLMAESNIVVMDLRGFSTANQGCLFELQSLIDIVPVARVVLLTDKSTDAPFLEQTLASCWRAMSSSSPNVNPGGALTLLETGGRDVAAVEALLRLADDVLASVEETGASATVPMTGVALPAHAVGMYTTTLHGGEHHAQ